MNNGLYTDLNNEDYHSDKNSISTSLIKKMSQSFAHAKYSIDNPQEYKDCFRIGNAIHTYLLEPELFDDQFFTGIDVPRRSKDNKMEWELFFDSHGADGASIVSKKATEWHNEFEKQTGKKILLREELQEIKDMAESVKNNPSAFALLNGSVTEHSIFWSVGAQQLRCRPDIINNDIVVDLKSVADASPSGFAKAVANFGYDIQQAIYEEGCNTQFPVSDFLFIAVESKPPHLTAVYRLKGEYVARARLKYKKLLAGWDACKEFDIYPGYSDDIVEIDLPKWYK